MKNKHKSYIKHFIFLSAVQISVLLLAIRMSQSNSQFFLNGEILANLKSLEVFYVILVFALFSALVSYLKVNRDYERETQRFILEYLFQFNGLIGCIGDGMKKEINVSKLSHQLFSMKEVQISHQFVSTKEVQKLFEFILNSPNGKKFKEYVDINGYSLNPFASTKDHPLSFLSLVIFEMFLFSDHIKNVGQRFNFICENLYKYEKLFTDKTAKLWEAATVLGTNYKRQYIRLYSIRIIALLLFTEKENLIKIRSGQQRFYYGALLSLKETNFETLFGGLFEYKSILSYGEDKRSDNLKNTENLIMGLDIENKIAFLELVFQHGGKIITDINNYIQANGQDDFDLPGYLSQYNNSLPQSQLSNANLNGVAVNQARD